MESRVTDVEELVAEGVADGLVLRRVEEVGVLVRRGHHLGLRGEREKSKVSSCASARGRVLWWTDRRVGLSLWVRALGTAGVEMCASNVSVRVSVRARMRARGCVHDDTEVLLHQLVPPLLGESGSLVRLAVHCEYEQEMVSWRPT